MNTLNDANKKKLPFGVKVGYSVGTGADSIAFEFVAAFLIFYLTDMAGVDPIFAGIISSVAIVWDAITDPIIGNLSDRTKCKMGRRRPWMLASIVPLVASIIFLFTTNDMSGDGKNVYYLVCALVFWTSYTAFAIPYYSFGASITDDYDERSWMRVVGMIFSYIGVFVATAMPAYIAAWRLEEGATDAEAWSFAATVIAILGGVAILISFLSTAKRDIIPEIELKENKRKTNIFVDCLEIMKIKPALIAIAAGLTYRIGYALFIMTATYYIIHVVKLDEIALGNFWTVLSAGGIAFAFILAVFIKKVEKKKLMIALIGFSGIGMIIFSFLNVDTFTMVIIFVIIYLPGAVTYWALITTLVYDIAIVDEFKNNKRREGTAMAFFLFTNKVGYAVAAMAVGSLLTSVGYDPELATQSDATVEQLNNMFTLYPGIFMAIAAVIMIAFPITKAKHDKMSQQLELKKAGKEYSTEGFENLIK